MEGIKVKRILHINQYGSCKGGAENYIKEIAQNLKGYEHYLLYSKVPEEDYLRCFKDSSNKLNFLEKIKPTHVIIYNTPDKSISYFIKNKRRLNYKLIKSVHDYGMIYAGTGYNRITLKRLKDPIGLHSIFDCFIRDAFTRKLKFVNPWKKKKLLRELNYVDAIEVHTNDMKKTLVRNGVKEKLMFLNPPWAKVTKNKDIKYNQGEILFVGNLIRGKGLKLLLKALRLVKTNYVLNVVGDGYQKHELKRYVKKHKLNVKFFGKVPKEKVNDFYKTCSFVVFPSIFEPFGFITLEAFNFKKPVIAFNVAGPTEVIENNKNGFLIKPFEVKTLAKKIDFLLKNKDFCKKLGEEGNKKLLEKFTFEKHLRILQNKLKELENGKIYFN